MNGKNAIMFRFGGIGDCLSLTAVAKILKDRGYGVHFCVPEVQVPLYDGLNYILDKVIPTKRLPAIMGMDCVPSKHGWISTDVLKQRLHKKDWMILEYRNLVENNSMWGKYPRNREHLIWNRTMNSNYANWVDLALAWANIDPTTIPNNDKRPHYALKESEIQWASAIVPKDGFIAINLESSSLARVIYSQYELADELVKRGDNVMVWRDNKWIFKTKEYTKVIEVNTVRESVALLSLSRLFVSSDSGFSHLCEAIGKKQVTVYTTVPSWTRMKYYKYATAIQTTVPCSPCFIIGKYCPIKEYEVNENLKGLTQRQKEIIKMNRDKVPAEEAMKKLNLTAEGLNVAFDSTLKVMEALKNEEPDCIKEMTVERIMREIDKCLQV